MDVNEIICHPSLNPFQTQTLTDRYVVLGNHRDGWIFGAIDPSSGTAAMLEMTRVLTENMKKTGWKPKRTMIFISWGAEEYGLVGSMEWIEQFQKQLGNRAVAYLNLDMALEGKSTSINLR